MVKNHRDIWKVMQSYNGSTSLPSNWSEIAKYFGLDAREYTRYEWTTTENKKTK